MREREDPNYRHMFDTLDRKILSVLSRNSRLSFRKLSRIIGISTSTLISRIEKLEKSGIIKKYTIITDHEKLGYDLEAIIEIVISKGKLLETEKEIAKHNNVVAVYDITGETDALVIAKFKSRKELNDFVKKILSLPYVERTRTHLVLNTIKEDFTQVF